jgi:hypothetical protein
MEDKLHLLADMGQAELDTLEAFLEPDTLMLQIEQQTRIREAIISTITIWTTHKLLHSTAVGHLRWQLGSSRSSNE